MMLNDFLGGAVVMGLTVAAVFFLKFWRRSRDSLFLAFAGAFMLLAIVQTLLTTANFPAEELSWLYLLRLAAFLLILGGFWGKNRRGNAAD